MRVLLLAACTLLSAGIPGCAQAPPALAERLRLEAIAAAEAQTRTLEGTYGFRVVAPVVPPPCGKEAVRLEFSHLSKKELTGRFFAAFRVFEGNRLAGTARVDLEGTWKGTVLQARVMLPRKSIPEPDQLEAVAYEGAPPPGFLQEIPPGHRLRQNVAMGKVLTRSDLEPIPLVSAGDRVRLELVSGGLTIATDALARSPGALGERVRLELPSRKQVQGVVTGEGSARITWR